MKKTRGTVVNPIPSQFNPLMLRLARLCIKSEGFVFEGSDEELLRSRNPRAKKAIAFAMASIRELEDWILDASGKGLEEFGKFIAGEGEE